MEPFIQIAMSTSFPNTGENIGGIYCEWESFRCQSERPPEDAVQRPHFIEKETAQPPIHQAQTREMLIALYVQVLNKFNTRPGTTSCTCVPETGPLLVLHYATENIGFFFISLPENIPPAPSSILTTRQGPHAWLSAGTR